MGEGGGGERAPCSQSLHLRTEDNQQKAFTTCSLQPRDSDDRKSPGKHDDGSAGRVDRRKPQGRGQFVVFSIQKVCKCVCVCEN